MQNEENGLFFRVPKTGDESFNVQREERERFYPVRHYHPEIQLSLILEGTGTRFIGDSISYFREGDIYLIGPNVPHVFRNDVSPGDQPGKIKARAISIYFKKEAFGESFFNLPETRAVSILLKNASTGILLTGTLRGRIKGLIEGMTRLKGFDRLLELMKILHLISRSKEHEYISQTSYNHPIKERDDQKISNIFNYVILNYGEQIDLDKAANIANMSNTAFCRYFKQRTRQTFTEFLNKTRIGQAAKMLASTDQPVSEIGYECGFNSIPYFTRQFKKHTGMNPLAYRRERGLVAT